MLTDVHPSEIVHAASIRGKANQMTENQLARIAELLHQRNLIDEQITQIIHQPMAAGHLGEWIASRVFDIELETSAVGAAIDGRFRAGPLRGKTVNIKWYLKRAKACST